MTWKAVKEKQGWLVEGIWELKRKEDLQERKLLNWYPQGKKYQSVPGLSEATNGTLGLVTPPSHLSQMEIWVGAAQDPVG